MMRAKLPRQSGFIRTARDSHSSESHLDGVLHAEMAQAAGTTEDEVLEGLESAHAYTLTSLDAPTGDEDLALRDQIGSEDEMIELLEYRTSLTPLLDQLPPREQTMLYLRFFKGMTQSEIADKLGISQMHVSRLLAKTLTTLREGLEG